MEIEVSSFNTMSSSSLGLEKQVDVDRVRIKRKSLQTVLEQCQRALVLLSNTEGVLDDDDRDAAAESRTIDDEEEPVGDSSVVSSADREADELCDLIKSRVQCPDFLAKLEYAQISVPQNTSEEGNSWDVVSENDLWESEDGGSGNEDYVLVREEDILDGIAFFTTAYLASLEQPKVLAPNQLQAALCKTFSAKKKKGKLRKAWEGSKVIYNVASWGATAIGIYQNPVLLRVASKAFWTSCQVVSKLL